MKPKVCALIFIVVSLFFTSMVWGDVDVPENIKKIAPIYEGAKVVQSMQYEEGAQTTFEVQAQRKEVVKFYKDTMEKKGWKVVMQMDMENNSVLNLAKDKMNLMINTSVNQKGKTMVHLVFQSKN